MSVFTKKKQKTTTTTYCFPSECRSPFQSSLCSVTQKHDWEAYCLCVCAGNFAMVGIWGGCSINTLCAWGESRLHKHTDMPTYSPATTHSANTQPRQLTDHAVWMKLHCPIIMASLSCTLRIMLDAWLKALRLTGRCHVFNREALQVKCFHLSSA